MINNVAEQAIVSILTAVMPNGIPIYVTDEPDNKKFVAPCLLVHAGEAEEILAPSSGIYKVPVNVLLRWHPHDEDREGRVQATTLLDRWSHGCDARDAALAQGLTATQAQDAGQKAAALALSGFMGFHCHGFVPTSGSLSIDNEKKTIDYNTNWVLWCMPRTENP